MTPTRHISSPSDLAHLATSLRSIQDDAPQTFHIHLLAPLAEADTLSQSLKAGLVIEWPQETHLDLSSFCKRW